MTTILTHINLFVGHENSKENIKQSVRYPLWKGARNTGRVTPWACNSVGLQQNVMRTKDLGCALAVTGKQMESNLKSIKALTRIQIRHVFFRQKAWDSIRIQFRLRDIRINGIFKVSKYHNIIIHLGHILHQPAI